MSIGKRKIFKSDFKHKQNIIDLKQTSNSSLSENVSINNDSDTPQHPLTPPPSPLSPNDEQTARSDAPEDEATQNNDLKTSITHENIIENGAEEKTDTQLESNDDEKVIEFIFTQKKRTGKIDFT